ncbi:MAG TPA: hypothetical protein DCX95_07080 [Elusimicrobia bacterium]|nr:hypothetical protein [Elusimicrobiota bacterium]
MVKNHEYILAYGRNAELVESVYGDNFLNEMGEIEHYCYNAPNPGNPPCEITFKAGCKIENVENKEFNDSVGDEVKLKIISGKMKFKNGILIEDVTLRGSFPYRNQIEDYFKNKPIGIPTLDYKGQEWIEIFFNSKGLPRYRKSRNTLIISSLIDDSKIPNYGSDDIKELFGKKEIFEFPKPKELIEHLCKYFITGSDIILDFFAGSGTTAHAILDLNGKINKQIKFICVQMPEKCDEDSEAFKAGYKTIAEIGKERIRRVIKKIKEEEKQLKLEKKEIDLGFKVFKLRNSNFKIWRSDIKESDLPKQLDAFEKPIKPESQITNMMWEILLKSGYDLNTKIEEKKLNGVEVFSVADGEIFLALSKINEKALTEITKLRPKKFICLDSLFSGNDQLKTNTALQLKDAGIDFKTI